MRRIPATGAGIGRGHLGKLQEQLVIGGTIQHAVLRSDIEFVRTGTAEIAVAIPATEEFVVAFVAYQLVAPIAARQLVVTERAEQLVLPVPPNILLVKSSSSPGTSDPAFKMSSPSPRRSYPFQVRPKSDHFVAALEFIVA